MNRTDLSAVTRDYIETYNAILERMIHMMSNDGMTGDITHDFIHLMIPHHMVAIEMSQNLLRYTTFIPLQNMAEDTVRGEARSIADMRQILTQCRCTKSSEADARAYAAGNSRICDTMFEQMKSAPHCNAINANYISEMMPHHLGGIRMAENALRFPVCDRLVPVLRSIIKTNTKEMRMMRRLQRYAVC